MKLGLLGSSGRVSFAVCSHAADTCAMSFATCIYSQGMMSGPAHQLNKDRSILHTSKEAWEAQVP